MEAVFPLTAKSRFLGCIPTFIIRFPSKAALDVHCPRTQSLACFRCRQSCKPLMTVHTSSKRKAARPIVGFAPSCLAVTSCKAGNNRRPSSTLVLSDEPACSKFVAPENSHRCLSLPLSSMLRLPSSRHKSESRSLVGSPSCAGHMADRLVCAHSHGVVLREIFSQDDVFFRFDGPALESERCCSPFRSRT